MAAGQSTKVEYHKRYRATPKGAAACAWNRLTSRAGAKYNHSACYATVEVRMSRAAFLRWAVPRYEAWFREHPGVTPSVDRIDGTKHYELDNLQLIPVADNRYKNSRHRNLTAPPGERWCCECQAYLPTANFYKAPSCVKPSNPDGFVNFCKPCSRARANRQRQPE